MNTKSPECWSVDPRARGLRVQLSPNHSFVLPFEHFIYSELKAGTNEEVLKLVFATHEVVLHGERLRRLETAMQRMELASVSAVPARYRSVYDESSPIVMGIDVLSPNAREGEQDAESPGEEAVTDGQPLDHETLKV